MQPSSMQPSNSMQPSIISIEEGISRLSIQEKPEEKHDRPNGANGAAEPRKVLNYAHREDCRGKGHEIVKKYPQATSINFEDAGILDRDLKAVSKLPLTALNLYHNHRITDTGIEVLVKNCTTLEELYLRCSHLSAQSVASIAKHLPHLKVLDIDHLGSECTPKVTARQVVPLLAPLKKLTKLNVSHLSVHDGHVAMIARQHPELQNFTLHDASILARLSRRMVASLACLKKLQTLRIEGQWICGDVVKLIVEHCPQLLSLHLRQASPLNDEHVSFLTLLTKLEALTITFFEGIKKEITVRNKDGVEGTVKQSMHDLLLCSQNKEKFLQQFYTDISIRNLVRDHPDLKKLVLRNAYRLTDESAKALATLKHIRHVEIADSQCTRDSIDFFSSCASKPKVVIKLKEEEKTASAPVIKKEENIQVALD